VRDGDVMRIRSVGEVENTRTDYPCGETPWCRPSMGEWRRHVDENRGARKRQRVSSQSSNLPANGDDEKSVTASARAAPVDGENAGARAASAQTFKAGWP